MNKKINFTEEELKDLKTVLKTVEPEIGIGPDHLYRIYDIVFRKSYNTKLEFEKGFIHSDKCYVEMDHQKITAREITDELIDMNLIIKLRVPAEDKNGNKIFHSSEQTIPMKRTLYKTLY